MPVGRDAGIGGVALALGLVAGLTVSSTGGPVPEATGQRHTVDFQRDPAKARVEQTDAGPVVRVDRIAPGAGPAGEDVLVEVNEYSPQYVANALESCRLYREERGVDAPRLAYWEGLRARLEAVDVVLPAPEVAP